jgi:hypothetical protein
MFEAFQSAQASASVEPSVDTTTVSTQDTGSTPQEVSTPEPTQQTQPPQTVAENIKAKAQKAAQTPFVNSDNTTQNPFTPNFKFKVMDKEHEIPELFRSVIKDEESQKLAKEIFEKAYGLDSLKPRFNEVREKYKEIDTAHKQVLAGINDLRELYQRGDFDGFFNRLQIPEEKILQWVVNKAKYNQLPPDQRQVLDEKRAAEQKAYQLEKQQAEYQRTIEEQATNAKAISLQIALEKPDLKAIVDAFDSAPGRKPGSFRQAVIDAGELAWYKSNGKVDLTPEQAIQQVLAFYGNPVQPQEPPIIPAQRNVSQPAAQAAPTPPPAQTVLPNVAGRQSASVSKSKPKSIADLKKLAAQMSG